MTLRPAMFKFSRPAPVIALALAAVLTRAPAAAPSLTLTNYSIGLLLATDPGEAASLQHGAELAIAHLNATSTAPLRLVMRGRPGQWGTDGNEAADLALENEVIGLIAPPSGAATHQVLQVSGRTQIPVVSICPDSSVTATGVPWAVRVSPATEEETRTIFSAIRTRTQAATLFRWAALVPPDRAGREAARDLARAARQTQSDLRDAIRLPSDVTAWKAEFARLLASQPDGLLVWLHPTIAGAAARELREAGFHGLLAGPSRLACESFLRAAGPAAEGALVPRIAAQASSAEAVRFEAEFSQQFGHDPDPLAYLAYDAVIVLSAQLQAGPKAASRAVLDLQVPGVSGPLEFDRRGNRQLNLALWVCQSNHFKLLGQAESPLVPGFAPPASMRP